MEETCLAKEGESVEAESLAVHRWGEIGEVGEPDDVLAPTGLVGEVGTDHGLGVRPRKCGSSR